MDEKINKTYLAKALGISRPTLDKYLISGFPKKIKEKITFSCVEETLEYKKISIENEIRLCEYKLSKLKEELNNLSGVD